LTNKPEAPKPQDFRELRLPVAEQRGNESRTTGMSSTVFSTGSAINRDQALMLVWHKERM